MASKEEKKKITGFPLTTPTKVKLEITYTKTAITAKASWDFSSASTDKKKNANRIEGVNCEIYCDTIQKINKVTTKKKVGWKEAKQKEGSKKFEKTKGKKVKTKAIKKEKKVTNRYLTTGVKKIKNVKKKAISHTWQVAGVKSGGKYTQKPFYPFDTDQKLDAIVFKIQGYNSLSQKSEKGSWNNKVPVAIAQFDFQPPKAPTGTASWTAETNTAVITITGTDEGKGKQWARTSWEFEEIFYPSEGKSYQPTNVSVNIDGAKTYNGEVLKGFYSGGLELSASQSFPTRVAWNTKYLMKFRTKYQGVSGDHSSKWYEQTYAIGHPPSTRITAVERSSGGDLVAITFAIDNTNPNYVEQYYQLQRIKDFTPSSERVKLYGSDADWLTALNSEVASDEWEDVGDVFNKNVRSFLRNYSEDRPSSENPFARTYYRVKATNDCTKANEYAVYGQPMVLGGFRKVPSARSETMEFDSIEPQSNGTSVKVSWHFTITYTTPPADSGSGSGVNTQTEGEEENSGTGSSISIQADDSSDITPDIIQENANSTGTEISWSDDANAWKSNQLPETLDAPDLDASDKYWYVEGKYPSNDNPTPNAYSAVCYIRGLTEGTPYYFQGRRYHEEEGDIPRTYGKYTSYGVDAMAAVTPTTKPSSVSLKAPEALPIGKDLEVSWTHVTEESDAIQKKWILYAADPTKITPIEEVDETTGQTIYKLPALDNNQQQYTKLILAQGENASGYMVVPYGTPDDDSASAAEIAKNLAIKGGLDTYIAEWGNALWVEVAVATTGDFTSSNAMLVTYETAPESYMKVPVQVTSPSFDIAIGTTDIECSAVVRISTTSGYSVVYPDKIDYQPSDQAVYSKKYTASDLHWQEYNGHNGPAYFSNVRIPARNSIENGQTYQVSVLLENERTHLTSILTEKEGGQNIQSATFTVNYPDSSKPQPLQMTKTRILSSDDLSVKIEIDKDDLDRPAGEVCYVYRYTPDGLTLIADNVSFGSTVVDKYAPYTLTRAAYTEMLYPGNREIAVPGGILRQSELRYRLAVTNLTGAIEWTDVGYSLTYGAIRFDWGPPDGDNHHHLDVPFNLEYSDVFTKGFTSANHLGEKRPDGYWDDSVGRTSSITTKMVKYSTTSDKESLRALANYNGPVFVRRPDGCAYTADVQVNNISMSYSEQVISVSFTITEINSVDEFEITESKEKDVDNAARKEATNEYAGHGDTSTVSGTWVKHALSQNSST